MTVADVLFLAWVSLCATSGLFRGFAAQLVALTGVGVGVIAGAWVGPKVLANGGQSSWVPLASLAGAALGAVVFGVVAGRLATRARGFLARRPALGLLDRAGGLAVGALIGLALSWLLAVLLLHQPALGLRPFVQRSALLPALVRTVPPQPLLEALERFDPLPLLPQATPRQLPPPDPSVLRRAGARAAAPSVVKILGTSCGLAVQGSGWVLRNELVATNAHVASGQQNTRVLVPDGARLDATLVYLDGDNDVALLRVPGLRAAPLAPDQSDAFPRPVALLGYPRDGALTATAGTAGAPRNVLAPDAFDRRVAARLVVPLRGRVQRGESGGPVVDGRGRVVGMIFGGSRDGTGGFAVPTRLILRGLETPLRPVGPGPCVG